MESAQDSAINHPVKFGMLAFQPAYNTQAEVDRFVEAVKEIQKFFAQ